jgi:AcrR family transcriptional regulator
VGDVPKLWTETIETHRSQVQDAILESTAALIASHGLRGVTMSQIAESSRIGRATLYKYYPDVESILVAWHGRQVARHLDHLAALGGRVTTSPYDRLGAVLEAYAEICYDIAHQGQGGEWTALLHRREHISGAERQLRDFVRDLIADAAVSGEVRSDVSADELAAYSLNALAAASTTPSRAALKRLVTVTLTGLRSSLS